MIAGEMENLVALGSKGTYHEYDELFGLNGKKKKQKRPKKAKASGLTLDEQLALKEAKQAKRRNFLESVKGAVDENGGLEGIGASLNNVFGLFKKDQGPAVPGDYEFSVGTPSDEGKKKPSTGLYVVGGAVVLGLVVWGISQVNKKNNGTTVNPAS